MSLSNKVKLYDSTEKLLEECRLDDLSVKDNSVQDFINSKKDYDKELLDLAKEYQNKLAEIKRTRGSIKNIKYAKDNLLCRVIELCEPPFYLKHDMFNYKAILLYFMRDFYGATKIESSKINSPQLQKKFFRGKREVNIVTNINSLFHLVNIPNKDNYIRKERIHERMMYDILEFDNYGKHEDSFKSKIASIGWLKKTLQEPDFIYDRSVKLSPNLEFDFLFVRETGRGSKTQKYMYHVVALSDIKNGRFIIRSQFPLEKDRKRTKQCKENISMLHKHVKCNEPIYQKDGIELPKDGISVDNLRDIFNDR